MCSRDDDPTQHDQPRAQGAQAPAPAYVVREAHVYKAPVSPWVRRALAGDLPRRPRGAVRTCYYSQSGAVGGGTLPVHEPGALPHNCALCALYVHPLPEEARP